jgi:RNA polymerase sigma factor (sigma-70 family)
MKKAETKNVEKIRTGSMAEWWETVRPAADYPEFSRILGMANRIVRQRNLRLAQEDIEYHIWKTLPVNVRLFDPAKVESNKPVDEQFLDYFAFWFSKRISQESQRARKKKRKEKKAFALLYRDEEALGRVVASDFHRELFWDQAGMLFRQALEGLDVVARAYIKYRYIENLTLVEIAGKLGFSERTLIRRFSRMYDLDNVVSLVRTGIRDNIRQMPREKLYKAVYSLTYENEFSTEEIARLFCMTVDEVNEIQVCMLTHLADTYADQRELARAG